MNVTDNGPPAAAEDKVPPSMSSVDGDKPPAASTSTPAVATTADSDDKNIAEDAEGDNTASDAPVAADQQSQINIIPELSDATSNAFTQLVLCHYSGVYIIVIVSYI